MEIKAYSKTIVAAIGAIITWAYIVVDTPSGPITSSEWVALAGGIATATGVWAVKNKAS
jgi:2-methylcitrate dehydratase PrpD